MTMKLRVTHVIHAKALRERKKNKMLAKDNLPRNISMDSDQGCICSP
jgi:hypothetical protein